MNTAVAFIIFNRPDVTQRVFDRIRKARPPRLLVIADGPRSSRPGEAALCDATRAIIDQVDWPCDVQKNYSEQNLGCGKRVSSGLDWVFQREERAIVLEDDCLPEMSFFPYCEAALERFKDEPRIMIVSGTNLLGEWKSDRQSAHYCYQGGIWGWASWRRAWAAYDVTMSQWSDPHAKETVRTHLRDERLYLEKRAIYDDLVSGSLDTWDAQWSFARIVRGGLSVVPAVNLISNIGFGENATHTLNAGNPTANLPTRPLTTPFNFPSPVEYDFKFDQACVDKTIGRPPSFAQKIKRKVLSRVKRMLQKG